MGNCQNLTVGNDPIKADKIKKNNSNNLMIKSYTWNRDSHGLFDYESKSLIKGQIKIPEPGVVYRDKDDVKLSNDFSIKDQGDLKRLINIEIRDSHYVVDSNQILNSQLRQQDKKGAFEEGIGDHCVWAVVKSLKTSKGTKGHELEVGDYLKLGRVRFRIKELQGLDVDQKKPEKGQNFYFGSNVNVLNMDELYPELNEQDEKASNSQNACRICLGENDDPENPFITPCKCDGTMKSIHVKCLQQWLKSRLHPKETAFSISFVWKTFDCELCKAQFPNMVKVKGVVYDTVEIPRPSQPYVTLEILSKDKNICKGIHVITLSTKNQIRLGRGHDSDIRISDISVSRCHAILSYDSGIFTIEDNNSKFGTLALVKDAIKLTNNNSNNSNLAIQVGRTVLSFTLRKNWKIYQAAVPPQPIVKQQVQLNEQSNPDNKLQVGGVTVAVDVQNGENPSQPKKATSNQKGKIKVIEAPGQRDEEVVMNRVDQNQPNGALINNNNGDDDVVAPGNKNLLEPIPQLKAKASSDQYESNVNNGDPLPEFKDPAEELEMFQKLKEKESEVENLEKQLLLLTQHRKINQNNLNNLPEVVPKPGEEHLPDHEKEVLVARIQQFTKKIEEIQAKLNVLKMNLGKGMSSNQLLNSERSEQFLDNQHASEAPITSNFRKNAQQQQQQDSLFNEHLNGGNRKHSYKGILQYSESQHE